MPEFSKPKRDNLSTSFKNAVKRLSTQPDDSGGEKVDIIKPPERSEDVVIKKEMVIKLIEGNEEASLDDRSITMKVLAIPVKSYLPEFRMQTIAQCEKWLKYFINKPVRFEHLDINIGMITGIDITPEGMYANMVVMSVNSGTTELERKAIKYVRDNLINKTLSEVSVAFQRLFPKGGSKYAIRIQPKEISVVFKGALDTYIEYAEFSGKSSIFYFFLFFSIFFFFLICATQKNSEKTSILCHLFLFEDSLKTSPLTFFRIYFFLIANTLVFFTCQPPSSLKSSSFFFLEKRYITKCVKHLLLT